MTYNGYIFDALYLAVWDFGPMAPERLRGVTPKPRNFSTDAERSERVSFSIEAECQTHTRD